MRGVIGSATIVAVFGVSSAFGTLKVQLDTTPADHQSGFDGGVFIATDVSTGGDNLPDAPTWATFCLETNEIALSNVVYDVAIASAAVLGGTGGGSPDPLDARSAYLYYTYRTNPAALNGALGGGASFTGSQAQRQDATRQLQEALWFIEQENLGVNNGLVALANGAGWTGIGPVRVLNLMLANPLGGFSNEQDVLILVPAPAAALLGVIGLGAVGWVKRRMV